MSMTKKEIVSAILDIKEVDTKSNLMTKKNDELEAILSELQSESEKPKEAINEQVSQEVDMTALMEKMKAEMMAELKEQARKEVQAEIAVEVVDKAVEKPAKKVEMDRYEQIPVMNVTRHSLIYVSKKTGAEWEWSQFGDVEYIELQELISMRSGQKAFLHEPFLIILDGNAVNYLGLTKMYDKLVDLDNLDAVLKMNQESFQEVLDNSPKGIRHTIIRMVKDKVDNEEDISYKKVNYINERYKLDIGQRG